MSADAWFTGLLIAGICLLVIGQFGTWLIKNRRTARAVYWIACLTGSALFALSLTPRGLGSVALAAVWCVVSVVVIAIGYTPYLKIGGRVIAAHVDDSRPDEPDGSAPPYRRSSAKESYDGLHRADVFWWTFAFSSVAVAVFAVLSRWYHGLLFFVVLGTGVIAIYGFNDGRQQLPYGRGNRLPFIIFGVASLSYAGLPLLAYLGAYRLGQRPPKPGYGRHSGGRPWKLD